MKVISAAIKRAAGKNQNSATSWKFSPDRQITQDSGSGNNWARGFYVHGPRCREAISNVIRLEVGTDFQIALVEYANLCSLKLIYVFDIMQPSSLVWKCKRKSLVMPETALFVIKSTTLHIISSPDKGSIQPMSKLTTLKKLANLLIEEERAIRVCDCPYRIIIEGVVLVCLGPEDQPLILLIFQVEACDLFGGFLTAQSMAGGTGSGLGKIQWLPKLL